MIQANQNSSRAAALARRQAMSSGGKAAISGQSDRTRVAPGGSQTETAAPVAQSASSSAPSYRPRTGAAPAANSSRAAALARRKAMSVKGKSAATSKDRTRDQSMVPESSKTAVSANKPAKDKTSDCGCGCKGERKSEAAPEAAVETRTAAKTRVRRNGKVKAAINPSKAAALARRKAQSTRGKAALSNGGMSQAQTARAAVRAAVSRAEARSSTLRIAVV